MTSDDDEDDWAVRLGLAPAKNRPPWADDFRIQSAAELDFVIMEGRGLPVGMSRHSSPGFRRRVLAAALSYFMGNKSIDYTLKRYVDPDQYDEERPGLGDSVSDHLAICGDGLIEPLRKLHTPSPTVGEYGAEITLFRVPHAINVARMLANSWRCCLFCVSPLR